MIGGFIDLCIKTIDDTIMRTLMKLGFTGVVYTGAITKNPSSKNLRVLTGTVLAENSLPELRKKLSGIRSKYSFIIVEPHSISTARFSAHDTRVDAILMGDNSYKYIDKAQVSSMKLYGKPLLLDLSSIIPGRERTASLIYRRLVLSRYYGVNVIPVSCASSYNELIIPSSTVFFLEEISGISHEYWVYTISGLSRELIHRRSG